MTDIVERLRAFVAGEAMLAEEAIAEAADEIERLRADKDVQRSQDRNTAYEGDIALLEAEIERLRAALQPFAAAADTLPSFPDTTSLDLAPITLGDLRQARRALEPQP